LKLSNRLTRQFPREEVYGLTTQMRRAAVSVPSNIAEGQGRRSKNDFRRFVAISHGSLSELETQIAVCGRLGYLERKKAEELSTLANEVGRILFGLWKSLE